MFGDGFLGRLDQQTAPIDGSRAPFFPPRRRRSPLLHLGVDVRREPRKTVPLPIDPYYLDAAQHLIWTSQFLSRPLLHPQTTRQNHPVRKTGWVPFPLPVALLGSTSFLTDSSRRAFDRVLSQSIGSLTFPCSNGCLKHFRLSPPKWRYSFFTFMSEEILISSFALS